MLYLFYHLEMKAFTSYSGSYSFSLIFQAILFIFIFLTLVFPNTILKLLDAPFLSQNPLWPVFLILW